MASTCTSSFIPDEPCKKFRFQNTNETIMYSSLAVLKNIVYLLCCYWIFPVLQVSLRLTSKIKFSSITAINRANISQCFVFSWLLHEISRRIQAVVLKLMLCFVHSVESDCCHLNIGHKTIQYYCQFRPTVVYNMSMTALATQCAISNSLLRRTGKNMKVMWSGQLGTRMTNNSRSRLNKTMALLLMPCLKRTPISAGSTLGYLAATIMITTILLTEINSERKLLNSIF